LKNAEIVYVKLNRENKNIVTTVISYL